MSNDVHVHGVHFVGTIPFADSEEVFRATSQLLGDRVTRLPDGETGSRLHWVWIQVPIMQQHPDIEQTTVSVPGVGDLTLMSIRDGVDADQLDLGNIGYADFALDSYEVFSRLKDEGVIAPQVRFQVNLPTPAAICSISARPDAAPALESAYERALARELHRILALIPHDQLAVQWDTAIELIWLAGWRDMPPWYDDVWSEVRERTSRLGALVPEDVELGFHLCYGDFQHTRQVDLADARLLVDVANALATDVPRRIDFLHLPVRGDVDPAAYLAPLTGLELHPDTDLYLGLITDDGGLESARQRVAAAGQCVSRFGVGTECGMGRRAPETVPALLEIHRDLTVPSATSTAGA